MAGGAKSNFCLKCGKRAVSMVAKTRDRADWHKLYRYEYYYAAVFVLGETEEV